MIGEAARYSGRGRSLSPAHIQWQSSSHSKTSNRCISRPTDQARRIGSGRGRSGLGEIVVPCRKKNIYQKTRQMMCGGNVPKKSFQACHDLALLDDNNRSCERIWNRSRHMRDEHSQSIRTAANLSSIHHEHRFHLCPAHRRRVCLE